MDDPLNYLLLAIDGANDILTVVYNSSWFPFIVVFLFVGFIFMAAELVLKND